jgi:hypothetical protein
VVWQCEIFHDIYVLLVRQLKYLRYLTLIMPFVVVVVVVVALWRGQPALWTKIELYILRLHYSIVRVGACLSD